MLNGSTVSWKIQRQQTVALSTVEAEYMALIAATHEAMFLKQLLHEFHQDSGTTITIHEDNQSCTTLSKSNMTTRRSQHMDVKNFFCQEKVESENIEVQYCATDNVLVHVLTKPLVSARHNKLCNAIMGLPALQGGVLRDIVLCDYQVATHQCWSSSIVIVRM
jgi:hypothetical protein